MKKTFSVSLGASVFNIEEDAYEKLKEYLDSIKDYFSDYEDSQEIIDDIEIRAAEKFSSQLSKAKKVIVLADVEELIETMGTVEAIAGIEEEKNERKKKKRPKIRIKKLLRNSDDVMIAGVCSGLAAYFGIDPVIVRLVFFGSIFFGGTGIILYLILWLIMPEAKTAADKMEMRGNPVTLSGIKEAVESKVSKMAPEKIKKKGWLKKSISLPFKWLGQALASLGKALKHLLPACLIFFGVILLMAAIPSVAAIFLAFGSLIFNIDSPFIDFPVREVLPGADYYIVMISGMFIALIPVLFLLLAGISFVRRKSAFSLASGLSLIFFWILSIVALGILTIRAVPVFEEKMEAIDSSENITRLYDLKDFDKISVSEMENIIITKGDEFRVEATGKERDIERRISIETVGDSLRIRKKITHNVCILCLFYWRPVTISVTMPSLKQLEAQGVVKSEINGFSQEELNVFLSGVSRLKINAGIENLFLDLSGVSRAFLNATSTNMKAVLEGASYLEALEFPVKNIDISLSGASQAKLWAEETLNILSEGSSRLYYKGDPALNEKIRGAGRVQKLMENATFEELDVPGRAMLFNEMPSEGIRMEFQ